MNRWMEDPRVAEAERLSFEAERAERRGESTLASEQYRSAGQRFRAVALSVPASHPRTRGDLAVAAVVCLARGTALAEALAAATRFLAEPDAMSEGARDELRRLASEYVHSVSATPMTADWLGNQRREIRSRFRTAA